MGRIREFFQKKRAEHSANAEMGAKKAVLEELFNDMYTQRHRVYKVNFVRGILFGAGSAIGGTIVLALVVWILSLFVNAPFVGEVFKNAQQSIEQTSEEAKQKSTE